VCPSAPATHALWRGGGPFEGHRFQRRGSACTFEHSLDGGAFGAQVRVTPSGTGAANDDPLCKCLPVVFSCCSWYEWTSPGRTATPFDQSFSPSLLSNDAEEKVLEKCVRKKPAQPATEIGQHLRAAHGANLVGFK